MNLFCRLIVARFGIVARLAAVLVGWFCFASAAHAVVVLSDAFSYPNGSLITNSAFFWNTHSGTTGQTQVASGRVQLSQSQTEDVAAALTNGPFTSGTLYANFVVNFSTLPSGAGNYFAHFKDGGASSFRGKIFATTSGAATGKFRVGVANVANSADAVIPTDLVLGGDYTLVVRYTPAMPSTTLWINPENEDSATDRASATDAASTLGITTFALRQSNSGGGMGVLTFDDLIVATSFEEVRPPSSAPPVILAQPDSQSVTQGVNVTFTVAVTGSMPLHYQWFFDDTPLAGATSAALILSNVSLAASGDYQVTITNAFGTTNSEPATLIVNPPPAPPVPGFSLLTYNVAGNGVTDWSTNSPQVRAIGRQMQYLNPDIITFQEIPFTLSYEMTNFVATFLPGYALARNSGTDGSIRSVIASRFPITRSQSRLDGIDLRAFGYSNANNSLDNFTRDLFEAQINVSGFPQPLHVFTTHLKATSGTTYADAAAKRAAEAAAITNFLATNILAQFPLRPYVLTGDLNDSSTNALAIQTLISPPTGLFLTNPTNVFTGSLNTFSIRSSLSSRLDYILPNALLLANAADMQVFRTDLLPSPPPPLLAGDSATASDHLPVLMVFNNPYDKPFRLLSVALDSATLTLTWESVPGQPYRVETSSNLVSWSTLAGNLLATNDSFTFTASLSASPRYYRVARVR